VSHLQPDKDFLQLRDEWYEKLSQEGFNDIEDKKGNLKQYDRRTIAFENRDIIETFYRRLDHYLTDHPEIPEAESQILQLYTEGTYLTQIKMELNVNIQSIKKVIKKYRNIILSNGD
jgi:hypothetical protein